MSIIIPTFVLSVVNTETGSGNTVLAEARLQPALIYNKGHKKVPHRIRGNDRLSYVIEYILNFTSHQDFEQLIPYHGENEFYI